jgi:hypothetical protein
MREREKVEKVCGLRAFAVKLFGLRAKPALGAFAVIFTIIRN